MESTRVSTRSLLVGEWTVVPTDPGTDFNSVTFTDGWPYEDTFTPVVQVGTKVTCNIAGGPAAAIAAGD